ncbi:MAG: VWA domain-containing protein [Hyphomicrobiales bacterium]
MSFAHPWVLAALVLVPLVAGAWAWGIRRGRARARALSRDAPRGPHYFGLACFALALAASIFAAAQPRWGNKEAFVPRQGAELIVVMDVSRSMAARDVDPTRLEAAKNAVIESLSRLGGDRIGLVVFAGDARVRFPLTTDFAAAEQVVRSLDTGSIIVEGGSSTSQGLDVALSAFDQANPDAGRLILLLTDGDDLGADPAAAATRVRESGAGLLVVGVGTPEGARVPVYDARSGGFVDKLDANGVPIISKLNEPFLRSLAVAGGGQYLGSNLAAVPGAVDSRIASLTRAQFERQAADIPVERFQWFAAAAVAFLVLGAVAERLPRPGRREALAFSTALLGLFLLSSCATRAHDLNEDGRQAMRLGDAERAVELFQEAQAEEPDNETITLNLAIALHATGRYDEAGMAARRALLSGSAETRAKANASIGHHRFAQGDLQGSLEAFRSALIEDPGDDASRHDYEVVLRLLQQRGQPPGEPGNGDQQNPEGSPTPGASGQTPDGSSTPPPGETPQPGQGDQPQPGDPGSGRPGTPEEIDQQLAQIDAEIANLMQNSNNDPSTAEALRILELLAERARIAAMRNALEGGGDPNDY